MFLTAALESSPGFCAFFLPQSARESPPNSCSRGSRGRGVHGRSASWWPCSALASSPVSGESLLLSVSTPGHTPPPWPFAVVTMESAPVPFFLGSTNGPLSFFNGQNKQEMEGLATGALNLPGATWLPREGCLCPGSPLLPRHPTWVTPTARNPAKPQKFSRLGSLLLLLHHNLPPHTHSLEGVRVCVLSLTPTTYL